MTLTKNLLIGAATLALLTSSAFAADLPSRRSPPVFVPPPVPIFSWTGLYVGGQVGYAFGRTSTVSTIPAVPGFFAGATTFGAGDVNGAIGGGHVGYNFAMPGGFGLGGGLVIGVEGDLDGTNASRNSTFAAGNPLLLGAGSTTFINHDIEGSARGRFGLAVDRALFYVTGGAAFTQFQGGVINVGAGSSNFSDTRVGWTVGGGVEYAITPDWSLRAEYRYTDFGAFGVADGASSLVPGTVSFYKETEQRAQVGFSYKFDSPAPAPVVARY